MLALQEGHSILEVNLKEAKAATQNNNTAQAVTGNIKGSYMVAQNTAVGFVELDKEETRKTGNLKFKITGNNPIVVVAKCPKVMLRIEYLRWQETLTAL